MANPPITIGPFDNVPAPGSPIRSDWPQTISRWVVDHSPAAALVSTAANVTLATGNQVLSPTVQLASKPVAGKILLVGYLQIQIGAGSAQIAIEIESAGAIIAVSNANLQVASTGSHSVVVTTLRDVAAGAIFGAYLRGRVGSGSSTCTVIAGVGSGLLAIALRP